MTKKLDQFEVDRLIAAIEASFGDVRLGNGRSLHQAEAIDQGRPANEIEAARAWDGEIRWQEIPDEKIDHFCSALAFMDAEGFRFHVPRFIVWSLVHAEQSDSFAVDAAIYSCVFTPKLEEKSKQRYSLLNAGQRSTISAFLRFASMYDHFDASAAAEALQRYWWQFE